MVCVRSVLVVLMGLSACNPAQRAAQHRTLDAGEARRIVLATPVVAKASDLGRCPKAELTEFLRDQAFFQVRSTCISNSEGSGLLGNYTVDRRTGEVWYDVDKTPATLIDSPKLRSLRQELFDGARKPGGTR